MDQSCIRTYRVTSSLFEVEDGFAEFAILRALQWLGHKVGFKLICWAVFHFDIALLDLIRNKEVTDIDMARSGANTLEAILL